MKIFPYETRSVSFLINKPGYGCWHLPGTTIAGEAARGWKLSAEIQQASNSLAHLDTGFPLMFVFFFSELPL